MKSWVSSAYCCWSTLKWEATNWMGEIKEVKRIGPSTDPCGTPVLSNTDGEMSWPTFTYWDRWVRWDRSQFKAVPSTPYIKRSRSSRIAWSMVSKAALRSSDTRSVDSPWSAESLVLLSRVSRAVSVEWQLRYADWKGLWCGELMRWGWSQAKKRRSRIFEMLLRLEIGL